MWSSNIKVNFIVIFVSKHFSKVSIRRSIHRKAVQFHGWTRYQRYGCYNSTRDKRKSEHLVGHLVGHFSSFQAKTIIQGNTIKPTNCYLYHKQKTYQQERMKHCIFVIFIIKNTIKIWIKASSKDLHSTTPKKYIDTD